MPELIDPTTSEWSADEIQAGVALLAKMGKTFEVVGKVPELIFDGMCSNLITSPIELGVVRYGDQGPEILLIKRHDRFFKGWHMPGSVILPGRTVDGVLQALIEREVGADLRDKPTLVRPVEFMKGNGPGQCARGQEQSLLYMVQIDKNQQVKEGRFFPMYNLPKDVLAHHQIMVVLLRKHLAKT